MAGPHTETRLACLVHVCPQRLGHLLLPCVDTLLQQTVWQLALRETALDLDTEWATCSAQQSSICLRWAAVAVIVHHMFY